jgi:hypothetical protein
LPLASGLDFGIARAAANSSPSGLVGVTNQTEKEH